MEARYLEILDEEILAFIRQSENFFNSDETMSSVHAQRRAYEDLCRNFSGMRPSNVVVKDRWVTSRENNIAVRDYSIDNGSEQARILFFHGGGFILGGLDSHDSICAEFCAQTGMSVTAVDYRLSPEAPHPAAYEDCVNVFRRLAAESETPIILVGDSAGGTLAASVAETVKLSHKALIGQMLIYPMLASRKNSPSYIEHANAPLLSKADIEYYDQQRSADRDLSIDATATPLSAESFHDLPPTVLFSAECDPLADDCSEYDQALNNAGVMVTHIKERGLVHGYLRARDSSVLAANSFARMIAVLKMLANKQWDFQSDREFLKAIMGTWERKSLKN